MLGFWFFAPGCLLDLPIQSRSSDYPVGQRKKAGAAPGWTSYGARRGEGVWVGVMGEGEPQAVGVILTRKSVGRLGRFNCCRNGKSQTPRNA